VSVLEGSCLGLIPRRGCCWTLDFQSARAAILECRSTSLDGGPDALANNPVTRSYARAGRAIRISAHRRIGLIFNRDSTTGRFLNPQERHNVFSQEKRRIRSHMTAEIAAGHHSRAPANLTQLIVFAMLTCVGRIAGWNSEADQARADGSYAVHRTEHTRPCTEDDDVQRRPENHDLAADRAEGSGEVVG
jgi:hypothetical protein